MRVEITTSKATIKRVLDELREQGRLSAMPKASRSARWRKIKKWLLCRLEWLIAHPMSPFPFPVAQRRGKVGDEGQPSATCTRDLPADAEIHLTIPT